MERLQRSITWLLSVTLPIMAAACTSPVMVPPTTLPAPSSPAPVPPPTASLQIVPQPTPPTASAIPAIPTPLATPTHTPMDNAGAPKSFSTPAATIVTGGLIVPGSEVSRIAVASDGQTIYALDGRGGRLFKSLAAGAGWLNLSGNLPGGLGWRELAVAPDDPRLVAVATAGGSEIWLSADGGNSFVASGLTGRLGPGERVATLDISPVYAGRHDVILGTAGSPARGRVWALTLSPVTLAWADVSTGAAGWPAVGADVFAVRCSPSYATDGAILAVAASERTLLFLGERNLFSGAARWNQQGGFPVEIGEATPGAPLEAAGISLPADYSSGQPGYNRVYACWSKGADGDAYRVDGNRCTRLNAGEAIASLAYYGTARQGKLLAGALIASPVFPSIQAYLTANPTSARPDWLPSAKPPTGQREARVAWAPDGKLAYCGTRGGSSAFSRSEDDGMSWNQVGLISG